MSLQLVLKHSSVSGKAPTAAQLAEGEISVNINADGPFLCCKDTAGDVIQLGGVTIGNSQPTDIKCAFWLDISGAQPELKVYTGTAWVGTAISPTITSIVGTSPVTATTVSGTTTIGVDSASQTQAGVVELATSAETTAGTSSTLAVHPAGLKVELDKKAELASPAFTGNPTAPTQLPADNSTRIATTEFVDTALTNSEIWSRSSGNITPVNAADTLELNSSITAVGPLGVGLPFAPGAPIHTKATGTSGATLAIFDDSGSTTTGRFQIDTTGGDSQSSLNLSAVNRRYLGLGQVGSPDLVTDSGTNSVLIGGTLPLSPNITLNSNGSIDATGNIKTTASIIEAKADPYQGANTGTQLRNGTVVASGDTTNYIFLGYTTGTAAQTISIYGDGRIATDGNITSQGDIQTASQNGGQLAGNRNLIINGGMTVCQRLYLLNGGSTTFVNPSNATYQIDRFRTATTISDINLDKSTDVPTGSGFINSLQYTRTTGGALGVDDWLLVTQQIEGFNTARLAYGTASAKTITVSFWARSSVPGNYSITLRNLLMDRSYIKQYNLPNADWNYITLTIPGCTDGTWETGSSSGLELLFALDVGSNAHGTADSWSNDSKWGLASDANTWADTTSNTFNVTGVQIEIGSVATPFEYESYGDVLSECQRYYQDSPGEAAPGIIGPAISVSRIAASSYFIRSMRATPTVTIVSPSNFTPGKVAAYNNVTTDVGANFAAVSVNRGGWTYMLGGSGLVTGDFYRYGYYAEAEL